MILVLSWRVYLSSPNYLVIDRIPFQIAGEPLDQEVVQYGPFVMTTREEVQKTLLDCKLILLNPSPDVCLTLIL
jgi:hypothetical protein